MGTPQLHQDGNGQQQSPRMFWRFNDAQLVMRGPQNIYYTFTKPPPPEPVMQDKKNCSHQVMTLQSEFCSCSEPIFLSLRELWSQFSLLSWQYWNPVWSSTAEGSTSGVLFRDDVPCVLVAQITTLNTAGFLSYCSLFSNQFFFIFPLKRPRSQVVWETQTSLYKSSNFALTFK